MLDLIKNLLRKEPEADYAELVRQGAVILDVRSKSEYASGHLKDSINIPVDQLSKQIHRLPDKKKVVITCCASGMRSASAVGILKSAGFEKVYNGGGWTGLKQKL